MKAVQDDGQQQTMSSDNSRQTARQTARLPAGIRRNAAVAQSQPERSAASESNAAAEQAQPTALTGTLADYLEHVRVDKRLAQRTQQLYHDSLMRLQALAGAKGVAPETLQAADLRAVLAQLHGGGYSAGSLAIVLSGWRGYYHWLGLHGSITADPTAGIRPPRGAKPLPKALGVEEALQLVRYRDD